MPKGIKGDGSQYNKEIDENLTDKESKKRKREAALAEQQQKLIGAALKQVGIAPSATVTESPEFVQAKVKAKEAEASALNTQAMATKCAALKEFMSCEAIKDEEAKKRAQAKWEQLLEL